MACGFGKALRRIKPVCEAVPRRFGSRYSEAHVWRLLGKLGFPSKEPERQSKERDEAAIAR